MTPPARRSHRRDKGPSVPRDPRHEKSAILGSMDGADRSPGERPVAAVDPVASVPARERAFERLTELAAEGDRAALERLLEHHLPELRRYVRYRAGPLVRSREASSDLVQSVCREVLERAGQFRHASRSAFRRWLFATALRKIVDRRDFYLAQRRDALREVPLESDGTEGGGALAVSGERSTPSHCAMVSEEMERLERAFDQLGDEQRQVVTLAHVVGLSRREIAEQLGKSEGAVRMLLHRALARLSSLLG